MHLMDSMDDDHSKAQPFNSKDDPDFKVECTKIDPIAVRLLQEEEAEEKPQDFELDFSFGKSVWNKIIAIDFVYNEDLGKAEPLYIQMENYTEPD